MIKCADYLIHLFGQIEMPVTFIALVVLIFVTPVPASGATIRAAQIVFVDHGHRKIRILQEKTESNDY